MLPYSDVEHFYMVENILLNSTKHVQDVFTRRWKAETGTIWKDDEDNYFQNFLHGPGRTAYDGATSIQKAILLKSSKVRDWSLSTLCLLLHHFGPGEKYKKENSAVADLNSTKSYVSAQLSNKISKPDYTRYMVTICKSLMCLGMEKSVVQGLKSHVESKASSQAYKHVQLLYEKAKLYSKKGLKDKVFYCYDEAIQTPNLLPAVVAAAYEIRATFRISLAPNSVTMEMDKEKIELALEDLQKALSITDFSWTAHQSAARCHKKLGHLSQAVFHYEQGLSLFPLNEQMKREYQACKKTFFTDFEEDHFKPVRMAIGNAEYLKIMKEENKYMDSLSQDNMDKTLISTNSNNDPENRRRRDHFRKSGSPDGIKRQVNKALELYFKAAQMGRTWQGLSTPIRGDPAVASIEYAIGRMYFDGNVVTTDYEKAAYWFEKSMDNGHAYSSTILGNMYACGLGVDKNLTMAELCWKEGVNLKCPPAFKWLVRYYLDELEPELALEYFLAGRAQNNAILLSWPTKPFDELIQEIKKYRKAKTQQLDKFEKDHSLETKLLTFQQRLDRYNSVCYSDPIISLLECVLELEPQCKQIKYNGGYRQTFTREVTEDIKRKARNGSNTAKEYEQVLMYAGDLRQIYEGKETLKENEMVQMLDIFYNLVTIGYHLVPVLDFPREKVLRNIMHLLKQQKYQRKGPIDMKLKLCSSVLSFRDMLNFSKGYVLSSLAKSTNLYPENVLFHLVTAIEADLFNDFHAGRYWAVEGLKRDPSNVELLHFRTILDYRILSVEYFQELRTAYMEYLRYADDDHRWVPDGWYRMFYLYLYQLRKLGRSADVNEKRGMVRLAVESLRRGLQAEKVQLQCYLPYARPVKVNEILMSLEKNLETEIALQKKAIQAREKNIRIMERKPFLMSPTRKLLLRLHRRDVRRMKENNSKQEQVTAPELKQPPPKNLSCLSPITLQEMNPFGDTVFDDKFIELTVLDDSYSTAGSSIFCVVEDDKKDVIHLHIYNVDVSKKLIKKFKTGSRLALVNPFMKLGSEHKHNCLGADGIRFITFLESVKQMCGFCGEENASHKCSKCGRLYCSRECLELEVERNDHELVCGETKR